MNKTDEELAHDILTSLCSSSLVSELDYYREEVQADLKLSDKEMERLYSLPVMIALLVPKTVPVKTYKGKQVYPKPVKTCPGRGCSVCPGQEWVCDRDVCRPVEKKQDSLDPTETVKQDVKEFLEKEPDNEKPNVPVESEKQVEPDNETPEKEIERDIEPQPESDDDSSSESSKEEVDKAIQALQKMLSKHEVDYNGFTFSLTTNGKSVCISGVGKNHKELMRKLEGTFVGSEKKWRFDRDKLIKRVQKSYNEDDD